MAGQEDWKQININGFAMWGHRPCGQVLLMDSTQKHLDYCPAVAAPPAEDEEA